MPYYAMTTVELRGHIDRLKNSGCTMILSGDYSSKKLEDATRVSMKDATHGCSLPLDATRPSDGYDDWLVRLTGTHRFTWHQNVTIDHYFTVDPDKEIQ